MAAKPGAMAWPLTAGPAASPRRLWARVSRRDRRAMEEIARLARAAGSRAYLVGGAVRDLLLAAPLGADFDLAIVGDAVSLAETVAAAWGTAVETSAFRTAKLRRGDTVFDLVTARRERYARPGVLPEIEPASIEDDLRRRDFSIHALAFQIPPAQGGQLLDPCGGIEDLDRKRLRVLHDRSFADDPTRVLRAVRFELRLAFLMDAATERLAKEAVAAGALGTISSQRLREELELAVAEAGDLGRLLRRLADLGAWRFLAGGDPPAADLARLTAWRASGGARDARELWLALACVLQPAATVRLVQNLGLPPRRAAEVLGAQARLGELERTLGRDGAASELAEAWLLASAVEREFASGSPDLAVRSSAARAGAAAQIGLRIDGEALVARGAIPGPSLGAALRATLAARRDERLREDEELDFALAWLAGKQTR